MRKSEVNDEDEHPALTIRVAGQIRRWRIQRRMTQRDLSRAIKAAESYISTVETTPRMPSFLMAMRIVHRLGLKPENLLEPLPEESRMPTDEQGSG